MESKTEIPDFEMETTATSIQNVVKETQPDIAQRNTENKSPIGIALQNTVSETDILNLDVGTVIKTEFPDLEIETTPTSIQYIAKATDKFSPEEHNDGDETGILRLGSTLNESPVMSLLSTENRNPNFEVKDESEIKTEITDFEIETIPTTIQYVASETEKFSTEEQLIHLDKRKFKRPYKCETCVIGFFSQKNHGEHMLCHIISPDIGPACFICDVTFATEQGFIMHCRIAHDELKPAKEESITSEEEVECTTNAVELIEVDTPPEDNNILNLVKRSQTSIPQPYKCSICNRSFEQMIYLKIHKRVHTGGLKRGLKIHETSHTIGKSYECYMCAKRFKRLIHLRSHERSHTGDKPYMCKMCAKRFMRLSNLTCHERSHCRFSH